MAGVEKKPVCWDGEVRRGEEGRLGKNPAPSQSYRTPCRDMQSTGPGGRGYREPEKGCGGEEPPSGRASEEENTDWILVPEWNGM